MRCSVGFVVILLCFAPSFGIKWHQEANTQKCLKEELQARVLVTGDYEATGAPGQTLDYIIRDSKGHILSRKEDVSKGRFTFITENYDTFEVCFISRAPEHGVSQEVTLLTKKGAEARSYEGLAEAAKLRPLELELKRLEDLAHSIVQDFAFMRKREEEMSDTNESTKNRVTFFAVFSLLTLFGLEMFELFYFRRYFRTKKLIQ